MCSVGRCSGSGSRRRTWNARPKSPHNPRTVGANLTDVFYITNHYYSMGHVSFSSTQSLLRSLEIMNNIIKLP